MFSTKSKKSAMSQQTGSAVERDGQASGWQQTGQQQTGTRRELQFMDVDKRGGMGMEAKMDEILRRIGGLETKVTGQF
jgi:hypothetical protein